MVRSFGIGFVTISSHKDGYRRFGLGELGFFSSCIQAFSQTSTRFENLPVELARKGSLPGVISPGGVVGTMQGSPSLS